MRHCPVPSHCLQMREVVQQHQCVGTASCFTSAGVHDIISRLLQICHRQLCQKLTAGCGSHCAVGFSFFLFTFAITFFWKSSDMLDLPAPLKRLPAKPKEALAMIALSDPLPHSSLLFHLGQPVCHGSWFCGFCSIVAPLIHRNCAPCVWVRVCCERAQLQEKC